jgi:hypothetical protein
MVFWKLTVLSFHIIPCHSTRLLYIFVSHSNDAAETWDSFSTILRLWLSLNIFYDDTLDHLVFIYLDFSELIFYRARLSVLHPTPNLENQVSIFMSPNDRQTSYTPRHQIV